MTTSGSPVLCTITLRARSRNGPREVRPGLLATVDSSTRRRHHQVHDGVSVVQVGQLAPSTLIDPGDEPVEHLAGGCWHGTSPRLEWTCDSVYTIRTDNSACPAEASMKRQPVARPPQEDRPLRADARRNRALLQIGRAHV